MSLNILLMSDTMIKERTTMHGNIDPKLIVPDLKTAQDMYIMPLLGTALFNKLLTIINDGTITTDALKINYKNLLDNYIVDAMMYYALVTLPITLSYQLWNKGVVRKQGDNTETPSMQELIDISNGYKNRAEFYGNRLRAYLKANATAYYPEYLNPGSTCDTVNPSDRAFTNPIWLGSDEDDCCNNYWGPYNS